MEVSGTVTLETSYNGQERKAEVHVAKGIGPLLLGRDLIKDLSVMTVNRVGEDPLTEPLEVVLGRHHDIYKEELGTIKGVTAKLVVDPTATPKFSKARYLPYAMKGKEETEIDRIVSTGILKPVQLSDWAAPVVPVLKQDGSLRLCGDYKVTVNQVSRLEQYPLPTFDDMAAKLAGGQEFSKLDLSHAYQQLPLDEESSQHVTNNTHRGLFTYNRLPFGLPVHPPYSREPSKVSCKGFLGWQFTLMTYWSRERLMQNICKCWNKC